MSRGTHSPGDCKKVVEEEVAEYSGVSMFDYTIKTLPRDVRPPWRMAWRSLVLQ